MFSNIQQISTNKVSGRARDGLLEVEYGYYPRSAVSKQMQSRLEFAFGAGSVKRTNLNFTTDSRRYDEYGNSFSALKHNVYEYNGKRYVRVKANLCNENTMLSNGERYKTGDYVWVEVEPVKWLVSEREKTMVTQEIIFASVQFNRTRNYKTRNFDKTDVKTFMDKHLSKEMFATSMVQTENLQVKDESTSRRQNPYDFDFNNVSEEDIIKGAIEANVAVFLHGGSGEGKSARVKQLDPDCEIIYLRNATPESLNGKSVYNSETGEMIDVPPTWFKKIKKKCEEEPDKIHIVFFDEITNALPSIQGMAFNIVLDGEVNGIWKLPENARVVAAGNDLNDSLAANTMAEPLFNRFAHVYINTTVDSWLKWASTPKEEYERLDYKQEEKQAKIHPAIYAYIASKSFMGEDVLRTPYTGEKPNADPRKWEMSSKVLYSSKQPEMLRALIGEDLTADFIEFCKQPVITIQDVLDGNYSNRDFDMNTAEKYATALGLSSVDDKNLVTIRNFVSRLGKEIETTFDTLWIHGDEKRLERIAELRMTEIDSNERGVRR